MPKDNRATHSLGGGGIREWHLRGDVLKNSIDKKETQRKNKNQQ